MNWHIDYRNKEIYLFVTTFDVYPNINQFNVNISMA